MPLPSAKIPHNPGANDFGFIILPRRQADAGFFLFLGRLLGLDPAFCSGFFLGEGYGMARTLLAKPCRQSIEHGTLLGGELINSCRDPFFGCK